MQRAGLLLALVCLAAVGACGGGDSGEDLGTCTITRRDQPDIVEHVTLDQCQTDFHNTGGASGWSWKPDK